MNVYEELPEPSRVTLASGAQFSSSYDACHSAARPGDPPVRLRVNGCPAVTVYTVGAGAGVAAGVGVGVGSEPGAGPVYVTEKPPEL